MERIWPLPRSDRHSKYRYSPLLTEIECLEDYGSTLLVPPGDGASPSNTVEGTVGD